MSKSIADIQKEVDQLGEDAHRRFNSEFSTAAQEALERTLAAESEADQKQKRGFYEAELASIKQFNGGRITPRELTALKVKWQSKGLEVF